MTRIFLRNIRFVIITHENYRVDFNVESSICVLLGFDGGTLNFGYNIFQKPVNKDLIAKPILGALGSAAAMGISTAVGITVRRVPY